MRSYSERGYVLIRTVMSVVIWVHLRLIGQEEGGRRRAPSETPGRCLQSDRDQNGKPAEKRSAYNCSFRKVEHHFYHIISRALFHAGWRLEITARKKLPCAASQTHAAMQARRHDKRSLCACPWAAHLKNTALFAATALSHPGGIARGFAFAALLKEKIAACSFEG